MKLAPIAIAAVVALGVSATRDAIAAGGSAGTQPSAEEIGARYATFAGSRENAVKLARGLASGKVIALRTPDQYGNPSMVAFDVPSGGMSWNDVQNVLANTQAALARLGIRQPTGAEVQAALLGGVVRRPDGTAVNLDGAMKDRPPSNPAIRENPHADGLPIYGATPEMPALRPTWWANYRPAERPSRQIEHQTGVVLAGYLR